MKQVILKLILKSLLFIDKHVVRIYCEYDYEDAPYCGHHRNGHNGYFTSSSFREGDGFYEAVLPFYLFKIVIGWENIDNEHYCRFIRRDEKDYIRYKLDYAKLERIY